MRKPATTRAAARARSQEGALTDPFDLSELFDEFRDEARGQVARLDDALRAAGEGRALSPGERAALLRDLHTLKGNAGMLGLRPMQGLVHAVEEVFKTAAAPGALPLESLRDAATGLRRAADRVGGAEQDEALAALERIRIGPPPEPSPASGGGEAAQADEADEADEPAGAGPGPQDLRSEMLRVPFSRLDQLLSQVGELGAALAGLQHWAAEHRAELAAAGLRRSLGERLDAMASAADGVRRGAGALRMVPVGRLLARFPPLVADLARERGKQVQVRVEGEQTELDKSTADALLEPVLHLVRNAVDHGIEPPAQRRAAGKPEVGTLRLRAAQEGDRVRIEVEDDGRGLDRGAIVARARARGLLAPGEEPPHEEVGELVFRAGFSTRERADEVSGRGIGLDVVRRTVTRLRGSVDVSSGEDGVGTCFVLRLPLTVAMVPVLFFRAAGETMALPAAEVEEVLRAPAPGRVGPAETVEVHGEPVPLVRLDRLFGWDGSAADPAFVVVVRRGGRPAALGAERLLSQERATIRALPGALGRPRGVSGAAVDARGRAVLLLDPREVMELNVDLYRGGGGGG